MTYSVAIYLTHLGYGGPEEGGWWYTYGEVCEHTDAIIFPDEDAAWEMARHLQPTVDALNGGRRPISSVHSNGVYAVEVLEGPARNWSNYRPYE